MARPAFTIGGLIYGGFFLLITLIVGASVAGILALRDIDASFAQVKDLAAVSKRGADLRNEAAILLRDAGAYAGDPTDARRKQVWAAAASIKAASTAMRGRLGPAAGDAGEYLDGIADNLDAFLGEFEKLAAFMTQAPDKNAAAMSSDARRIMTAMDRYGRQIARITGLVAETTSSRANDFTEAAQGELEAGIWRTGIIAVLCAVVGVAIALLVVRQTIGPLSRFTQVMTRLASGALDTEVPYVGQHNEIGAMARATDVFKAAMLDVKAARDEAEAAAKAKADFLAVMSHEIRTPMNGVLTMADLLHESRLDDEQRGMTQIVRDSARSLLTIINDILDFSKIEAGKLPLEEVEIDLGDVVRGVAELLGQQAAEKTLELAVFVDPALPRRVIGDPTRLRQILVNLTGNAIKFTEHGSVGLAARPAAEGGLRLEITDTGIGLTPAQQAKLFQPFEQADTSTARKYGGTGLGLSICRRLVELMGGRIGATSAPGTGSTFWFEIPLRPAARQPAGERVDFTGLRLLALIETPALARAVEGYLVATGIAVECTADGDDALDRLCAAAAEGQPYQILLLDHRLLDNPALSFGRAVLADPTLGETRILLLAPRGLASSRAEAARLGFAGSVVKPMHRADLLKAIAQATDRPIDLPDDGIAMRVAPLERQAPSREAALAAGTLILVAEDNPTNQIVIRKLLSRLGYQADIAANGARAWAALQDTHYGLLLTDCHMPEMDGYELTRRIRVAEALQDGRRLPIIALTADALGDSAKICAAAGMDGYLAKPIELRDLAAALSQWLADAEPPPAVEAPAPVAADGLPVFDVAQVIETFGVLDEEAIALLGTFVETTEPELDALEAAVAAGNWPDVRRHAHAAAGAARMAGAPAMAALCSDVELLAAAGDPAAGALAHGIRPAFAAASAAISALKPQAA